MKDNRNLILKKIIEYCDSIDECIAFFGDDEETFLSNKIYQKSCAFDIMQIGELAKSLPKEFKEKYDGVHWRGFTGIRDIIAHNYGKIMHEDIWIAITEEIPAVRAECVRMLSEK